MPLPGIRDVGGLRVARPFSQGTYMMTIISRIAAALLATSLLATPALAEVTGGTIVSIDPDAMTLTLDDGASYKLNSEINVSALKEGMEVYLSYNEINGENIVTDMDIEE